MKKKQYPYYEIGERLGDLMYAQNMTDEELAKRIGKERKSICNYRHNESEMGIVTLMKILRAKILYRNSAVKQAKYSYYKKHIKPHELRDLIDVEATGKGFCVKANDYAISAGVDLDELSELLKTHHTAIFQKAWETYFENINPNPDLTGFEDDVQIIGKDENND